MQYVFVITYGRSGSTVLMNFLNCIDGYCIRGENNGAVNALALSAGRLHDAQDEYAQTKQTPSAPWFGLLNTDAEAYALGLGDVFSREFLRPDENTHVTGFKEIRFTPDDISDAEYIQAIDFMAAAFPGSRFIFNTRNWREVARSGWWRYRTDLGRVRKCIEGADARFRDSMEKLGDRAFLIDYEEFKGKPEGFRPLLKWLGEELSAEQLASITGTKLQHGQRKSDDRGRLLRLRRALYWWTLGNEAFNSRRGNAAS
ncbi:sulfotransferase [Salipiger abyssi]|uniref:sulfotransferase n=1 Tax=Salipiger abyssi TaxID=1250539 RepID=UPI001A90C057|nr:sulfotransferase [Salipiger abyssi]MBN9890476.1 sulfotransferase [Salipiger abyssi]